MIPLDRKFDLWPLPCKLHGVAGEEVSVAEDIRKCVLFIGHGDAENFTSCGTAFFYLYEQSIYLVTARHVVAEFGNDPFFLRLNRTDGTSETWHRDPLEESERWSKWHFPSDPKIDLAVMPFDGSGLVKNNIVAPGYDIRAISSPHMLVSRAAMDRVHIGPGDICHAVGLFKLVQGAKRNVPVVHTGRIAMNAGEELVPIQGWKGTEASILVRGYLVELTNLDGLSGAPVFVRGERSIKLGQGLTAPGLSEFAVQDMRLYLLGIWQGSWNNNAVDGRRPLAMGVVVPADELLTLLQSEELVAARAAHKAKTEQASLDRGA